MRDARSVSTNALLSLAALASDAESIMAKICRSHIRRQVVYRRERSSRFNYSAPPATSSRGYPQDLRNARRRTPSPIGPPRDTARPECSLEYPSGLTFGE